jgi:hypothetical protein
MEHREKEVKLASVIISFLSFSLFIYSHVHTLFGSFLHPAPFSHLLLLSPLQFQAGPVLPLSLVLLKKRHKHNKEDKAFFLFSSLTPFLPQYWVLNSGPHDC